MKRVFLGWDRPGLIAAVEHLTATFRSAAGLDLSGLIVAVPGARAGRRLLELLVARADGQGGALSPPQIVTIGHLPELLYVNRRPLAGPLVQHLAWIKALRRSDPDRLKALASTLPADGDFAAWLALAEMLDSLSRELAAENLSFADVAGRSDRSDGFCDSARWRVLAEVQTKYLETLDEVELWDRQTARRVAIAHREAHSASEILLVGTADLNRQQRLLLEQVSSRVTALIFAPEALADRFDSLGCLRPEAWQEAEIGLASEQIELADGPSDQAVAALHTLAAWGDAWSGEQITLGVPDASLVPYLEQQFDQAEVAVRYAAGSPLIRFSPCRLLAAVAEYLQGRQFSALASLVRHPAVQDWLTAQGLRGDWLSQLDDYYCRHLPLAVDGAWLGPDDECVLVRGVYEAIEQLLRKFNGKSPRDTKNLSQNRRGSPPRPENAGAEHGSGIGSKCPLNEWAEPIVDLLVQVFGGRPLDRAVEPDRTILAACDKVHEVLDGLRGVPETLLPVVHGPEAIRLVLRQLEGEALPPPALPGAIEMLGWLELPLDDAPAMIVTGMNEGIVPASLGADLFLPNSLRLELGLEDNERRYARDAYALSVLAASRACLKLILGRRSAEGDALAPSRLLFACDPETIARRACALFRAEAARRWDPLAGALRPGCRPARFFPPRPAPLAEPVAAMRVTEFRDYLACPYRYYLRHRLKLRGRTDAGEELDGASFGSLAHAVLGEFALSSSAASTDSEIVLAQLHALLDRFAFEWYGKEPLSAIRVQVEELRLRFKAFARWQADWAGQGWRIQHAEFGQEHAAPFTVDGRIMQLSGRIDRIDVNQRTGEVMIFDYKTSDALREPNRSHRRQDAWIDLQLPLYRHLARALGVEGPAALGYVVLPKDTSQTGALVADWTEGELAEADRVAENVVRGVWAERFWPPITPAPDLFEEFAAICLDGQFTDPEALPLEGGLR